MVATPLNRMLNDSTNALQLRCRIRVVRVARWGSQKYRTQAVPVLVAQHI